MHQPKPSYQLLSGYARLKELVERVPKVFSLFNGPFCLTKSAKTPSDSFYVKIEVKLVLQNNNPDSSKPESGLNTYQEVLC